LLSPPATISIGAESLVVDTGPANEILYLRRELQGIATAGVVVYAPLRTKQGMVMVRMETQADRNPVTEEVVATTNISETDFKKLLTSAQKPSAKAYRDELRDRFVPNRSRDEGKTVCSE
jgi:hypothetical protein